MTYAHCHRCQAELLPHDEGTLIFCTQCGAAQVTLSEELQQQADLQNAKAESGEPVAPVLTARSEVWAVALRCIALTAAIGAGLTLALFAVSPYLLLDSLPLVVSPVVAIGIFQARSPLTPMTTSFGARMGLLTGLAVALLMATGNTVLMVIARATHQMGDFDTRMNGVVDQWKTQIAAQPDAGAVSLMHSFTLPEFRAAMLLVGSALALGMFLTMTTAGGAFAGFLRAQKRA